MKIRSVSKHTVHVVITDSDVFRDHTRWGPESWTVRMGESDEQVYDCEELEKEFHAFMAKGSKD